MEPSCSGLGYPTENKDDPITAIEMKTEVEAESVSDMLNIEQLERKDLEEENRLMSQCSGVIVDARRLNLSSHVPQSSGSNVILPSSSENSSSLILNSDQNSSDKSDPIPGTSCSSSDDVSTPVNCCQNLPIPSLYKTTVTPPRPARPYFIPKFKLYEEENNSPLQENKDEDDSNNTSHDKLHTSSSKNPSNINDRDVTCSNNICNVSKSEKLKNVDSLEKPQDLPGGPSRDSNIPSGSNMSIPHPAILFSDYEDADSVEGEDEDIVCTCVSNCESEEDESGEDKVTGDEDNPGITASDGEAQYHSADDTKIWRKRKVNSPSCSNLSKKICNDVNADLRNLLQDNPPEIRGWLTRFSSWSGSERLQAIDLLIKRCAADQVRHMMQAIEPLFQRDFISLLPRELALAVLGFLEPEDLLRAAQTCRYWRFLADDNLLWKEQCRRIGIVTLRRRTRSMPSAASPWKSVYIRQRIIESNWQHKPMRNTIILKGHDDHVITCLQFYGNKILSGSDDTTLKVWSAVTGRCLRTLVGHTGGVWSSQMVGRTVISGSTDRTLRVWDANTGACLRTLTGHTSTVRCMHLFNDRVVSGSRDATLRVWSVPDGRCLRVLVGHMAAVRCVQYDGRLVVSGAYDYFVKVWNPETAECLHTLAGHTNRVYSLQFDGVHVVSGSLDTSIMVWDVESGAKKHTLMGHQSLTSGMELRSNILVSGNADSTVKIWDIVTGQCLHTLSGPNKHQSAVTCLQSNNRFVITSSDDGTVKLWDLKTGEFIRNLVTLESGGSGGVVWRIRASPTKLVCAVGSRNGTEETKLMVLDFGVPGACQKCDD